MNEGKSTWKRKKILVDAFIFVIIPLAPLLVDIFHQTFFPEISSQQIVQNSSGSIIIDKKSGGTDIVVNGNIYTASPPPTFDFIYDLEKKRFLTDTKSPGVKIDEVEWYLPGALFPANPIHTSNSQSLSHREIIMGISHTIRPFLPGFPDKTSVSPAKAMIIISCHMHWLSDHPNDMEGIPIGIVVKYNYGGFGEKNTIRYFGYVKELKPPMLDGDSYPEIKVDEIKSDEQWNEFLNNSDWLKSVADKTYERRDRNSDFSRLDEHFRCVK